MNDESIDVNISFINTDYLEVFNKVIGLCPKCRKSVIVDGWVCPCCGYDSSGEELYKYGD